MARRQAEIIEREREEKAQARKEAMERGDGESAIYSESSSSDVFPSAHRSCESSGIGTTTDSSEDLTKMEKDDQEDKQEALKDTTVYMNFSKQP